MQILRDAAALNDFVGGIFVPTMGALHAGHRALIIRAREIAAGRHPIIVSIFVNPTQFNERSDFDRYPRTLDADAALCAEAGASVIFAPDVEAMYPPEHPPSVPPLPAVATTPGLEDAHRPGHFAGVCQVCARLFALVKPSIAIFGEKDWQQLAVIRALVQQESLGIEILGHPTVREPDGLAMSSRNVRLAPNHRRQALALSRALEEAGRHTNPDAAERAARLVLLANRISPEYMVVRDAATLGPATEGAPARTLVAARVGDVRLIDNAPWPGFRLDAAP